MLIDILQIHLSPKFELLMIEIWIRGFRVLTKRRGAQQCGMHMWQRDVLENKESREERIYMGI
jgi:hypothetical protein